MQYKDRTYTDLYSSLCCWVIGWSFNKADLLPWFTVIIRGKINVPNIYLSSRISARNLRRRSHWIWTHKPVETHHNHWPLRGWVVVRRGGGGGKSGTTSKIHRVSTSKQHKGKPPEIYVPHNCNDWKWLYGDEWSLSKDGRCLIVTLLFAVLWFKHTLSSAREAFSLVNVSVNFCRSSASFMWYFSASLRRTFSLNTEREASSSCLNSCQYKQVNHWEICLWLWFLWLSIILDGKDWEDLRRLGSCHVTHITHFCSQCLGSYTEHFINNVLWFLRQAECVQNWINYWH